MQKHTLQYEWFILLLLGELLFTGCTARFWTSSPEQMGYVLSVDASEVLIDLDQHNGLTAGQRFLVVRREGESYHLRLLGEVKVTAVEPKLSRCEVVSQAEAFLEGDLVYRKRRGMDVTDQWEQPVLQIRGPVNKSGILAWDEVWSGEITMRGDVVVPHNITLTIRPGTQIIVPPNTDAEASGENPNQCELIINGRLDAEGTADRPIQFLANRGPGGSNGRPSGTWRGIRILSSQTEGSMIGWTHIEYAYRGIDVQNSKSVIIRRNKIQLCEDALIHCERSNVRILENDCHRAFLGIICNSCTATIEKNHISETEVGIGPGTSDVTLVENTVSRNSTGIKSNQNTHVTISRNTIRANGWGGMMIYGSAIVTDNTITKNGQTGESYFRRTGEVTGDGVMIFGRGEVVLTRNTITQNARYGVFCDPQSSPNLGDLSNNNPNDNGGNILHSNGHGNIETDAPSPIKAEGNFWQETTPAAILRTIHKVNSHHVLATVDVEPYRQSRFSHQLSRPGDPPGFDMSRSRSSFMVELDLDSDYRGWQSNGRPIVIHRGDLLTFQADGIIDFNKNAPGGDSDPNGHLNHIVGAQEETSTALAPGLPAWSLVGWLAPEGAPFFIGKRHTMIAPVNGLLHLGINDWVWGDNSGTFHVVIKVNER